jgi:type I restriction enzyme S subunit
MKSTESVRIGDVLALERREVSIDPLDEYRLVGVYSFGKGIFHRDPKPGGELGDYRFFSVEPGDLVLSNIQAWEGAIAFATELDRGTVGTHRFLTYVPTSGQIDTNWARWFFLSERGMQLIRQAAPGTAVRNRTLAVRRFEDLEIPLPSIDEQRRAAARLDRVWAATTDVHRYSAHATELTSALGVATAARPDLTEAERLDAGWKRVTLDSVLEVSSDPIIVDPSGSYPNLGIYSFGRGLFVKPDIEGATTSARSLYRVRAGQFVYSRLFAFEGAYAFVEPQLDGYFVSNEFPTFDADPARLDARWLASYLRSPDRWIELAASSKGLGVRRQRVPTESLLAYEIWLPPIEQQLAMVQTIERIAAPRRARALAEQRIASLVPATLNATFGDLP